jgi:hypothetical protein
VVETFSLSYNLKKSILHDLAIIRLATLWHSTAPLLSQQS